MENKNRNWINVPDLIGFNITNKCNLNCTYCFQNNKEINNTLTYNDVINVLNQLNKINLKELQLEGGEIFCWNSIDKLLKNMKNYNFRTHLISNGTLITRNIAKILFNNKISIGISLDGPTEYDNRFRGFFAYNKALASIKLLVNEGVTTYINCTLTKNNCNKIISLIDLCNDLKVYGLVIQQLHCSGNANALFYKNNFIPIKKLISLKNNISKKKEKYSNLYFVESEIFDFINVPNRFNSYCEKNIKYKPKKIFRCAAGRKFCIIRSNLDVIPCGILENFRCGNLFTQKFINIWKYSKNFQFIRKLSENRVDKILGCNTCKYNPICDGGCRGDMFNYSNDWLASHIFCPFNKIVH